MRIINYAILVLVFMAAPNCVFGQEKQIEIKEAYQATPYIGDPNNPDYSLQEVHGPEKCFDGDLSTFNHTADLTSESVWIEFDLGSIFQINTMTITNRKEFSYRLHNFYISVSDQPFGRGNRAPETDWLATFEGQKNFSLNKNGRYVRITLENGTNENVIHLAEVSFFGEVDKASLTTAKIETFNEAIKNNDERLVEDMIREVRPNSQSFVLAAEVGNYDLYELLVDEARLPDNKSIEKAIDNNHKDIYTLGLSNGGDATAALKYAIARGNDTAIKRCLAKKGDPKYAVTWAVSRSDEELANLLMEKYNISADKLLDESVSQMSVSMIKFALETGNTDPSPHLVKVLEANKDDLAKMMVDLGADPNKGIDFVVKNNNEALVDYFISSGADASNSTLILHASKNNFKITEILVSAGADPNIGLVPSIEANKEDISIFLINSGANPEPGLLPAINAKKVNIVKTLIDAGADADKGIIPACTAGLNNIVTVLIDGGADPNKGIEVSLSKDFTAVAETLIHNGADASTHLSIPIVNGNEKLTFMILDLGADPQTGMEAACKNGRTQILKRLIDLGANGNNGDYMTFAIASNSADMIPILFAQGVSPNAVYPDGENYIHKAARNIGGVHTVMKLHEGGVDVTKKDNNGNTPLHVAATSGKENVSLIEALVNLGCDVNAVNNSGETPRKIAKGMKTKNTLKKLGGLKKL